MRAAISPCFAVPYLEKMRMVGSDVAQYAVKSKKCLNYKAMMKEGGGVLLSCRRCRVVRYCSVKCQKVHWKVHKRDCNEVIGKEEIGGKEEVGWKEVLGGASGGDADLGCLSKAVDSVGLD